MKRKQAQAQTTGDPNIKAKPIITKAAIKNGEKAKDDKKKKFDDFAKK